MNADSVGRGWGACGDCPGAPGGGKFHPNCPEGLKNALLRKENGGSGGGGGRGTRSGPRALRAGNDGSKDKSKEVCRKHQQGYCRRGAACPYKHENPNGGGGYSFKRKADFNKAVHAAMTTSLKKHLKKAKKDKEANASSNSGSNPEETLFSLIGQAANVNLMMAASAIRRFDSELETVPEDAALVTLHDESCIGIDTDSARNLSTELKYFLYLDDSPAAKSTGVHDAQ